MAVPFRRKSSKKSREGRSVENLRRKRSFFSKTIKCENCQQKKVIHEVCKECSTYKGRKI